MKWEQRCAGHSYSKRFIRQTSSASGYPHRKCSCAGRDSQEKTSSRRQAQAPRPNDKSQLIASPNAPAINTLGNQVLWILFVQSTHSNFFYILNSCRMIGVVGVECTSRLILQCKAITTSLTLKGYLNECQRYPKMRWWAKTKLLIADRASRLRVLLLSNILYI